MAGEIAKLLRLVLDFESSTASSYKHGTSYQLPTYEDDMEDEAEIYTWKPTLKDSNYADDSWYSLAGIFGTVRTAFSTDCKTKTQKRMVKRQDEEETTTDEETTTEEGGLFSFTYKWGLIDIFNLPLGVIDGAMGALPSDSFAYYCNKNLTAARDTVEPMLEYWSQLEVQSAMTELTDLLSYTYNITWNCYYMVDDSVQSQEWLGWFGSNTPTTILYNMGYIYRDIITFFVMTPSEAGEYCIEYSYALGYLIGDFIIRFIYEETSTTE